jgi:hypothetical protein
MADMDIVHWALVTTTWYLLAYKPTFLYYILAQRGVLGFMVGIGQGRLGQAFVCFGAWDRTWVIGCIIRKVPSAG